MPSNKDLDEEQFEEFNKLSDVKKKTQDDRDRFYNYFYDFLEKSGFTEGKSLGEVLQTKEGRLKFSKLHATFFFTLRVRNDEIPKLAYAESIRSHLKNKILRLFNINITNPESFPNEQKIAQNNPLRTFFETVHPKIRPSKKSVCPSVKNPSVMKRGHSLGPTLI